MLYEIKKLDKKKIIKWKTVRIGSDLYARIEQTELREKCLTFVFRYLLLYRNKSSSVWYNRCLPTSHNVIHSIYILLQTINHSNFTLNFYLICAQLFINFNLAYIYYFLRIVSWWNFFESIFLYILLNQINFFIFKSNMYFYHQRFCLILS